MDRPGRGPSLHVGLCILEIQLPGAGSLKAKRQVLRSLKERLKAHFNVSVAEIDHQDLWQRATLGIVGIASARGPLEQTFASIQAEAERRIPGDILSSDVEFLA